MNVERSSIYREWKNREAGPETSTHPGIEAHVHEAQQALRETIEAKDPELQEEARSAKVFFDELGLYTPPLLTFEATPESIKELQRWRAPDSVKAFSSPFINARYDGHLDLALVALDRLPPDPMVRKAVMVHELAHGNAAGVFIHSGERYAIRGLGFMVTRSVDGRKGELVLNGYYPEEGRAELLAANYMKLIHRYSAPQNDKQLGFVIPPKYIHPLPDNSGYRLMPGAYAAIGLELLISKDPSLLDPIIHGSSNFEARKQLYQKIEHLKPGLRELFLRTGSDETDFAETTAAIVRHLFQADATASLKASQYTEELIRAKLAS